MTLSEIPTAVRPTKSDQRGSSSALLLFPFSSTLLFLFVPSCFSSNGLRSEAGMLTLSHRPDALATRPSKTGLSEAPGNESRSIGACGFEKMCSGAPASHRPPGHGPLIQTIGSRLIIAFRRTRFGGRAGARMRSHCLDPPRSYLEKGKAGHCSGVTATLPHHSEGCARITTGFLFMILLPPSACDDRGVELCFLCKASCRFLVLEY